MMDYGPLEGCAVAILVAALVVWLVNAQAQRLGLIDVPNERSSHVRPTPRGGGIGIVCGFLAGLLATSRISAGWPSLTIFVTGAVLIALVGLADDLRPVAARIRLLVHFAAALLAVWRFIPNLSISLTGDWELHGALAIALAVIAIVWMVNLYNFMDGIDGLAGSEAVFVGACGSALVAWGHPQHPAVAIAASIAAASLGFLFMNWPPAKVFMGDVGSGFLGFVFGALALWTAMDRVVPVWTWVALSGLFIVDATVTVIRRFVAGERVYDAHRSHAYQRISRRWASHRSTVLLANAINIFWLMPCAVATVVWPLRSALICAAGLTPMAFAACLAGAGRREQSVGPS